VIITLERYFKIVHAIAHRKYYRDWMTRVGVVVPWIVGFCTFGIPAYVWSKPVPGQCPLMMAPATRAQLAVGMPIVA